MNKFLEFNIQLFAHKKGQSSTSNGRDSAGRRLGAKAADGEYIEAGSIIYRQRGTKIHPGKNVRRGKDDTLYTVISGHVVDAENDLCRVDKKMIYNAPQPARNCFYRYKKECED